MLVDDVDGAAERAERMGGSVLQGPMDMPEVGRFALLADAQGGRVSAYKPVGAGDAFSEGVFNWDELLSADVEGSKRFYAEVFGWQADDMDMGELIYTVFKRSHEDTGIAGLMKPPGWSGGGATWVPYMHSEDVDASTAKAGELGASVHVPPMDVENVGRLSMLADPSGALFGLFKPST